MLFERVVPVPGDEGAPMHRFQVRKLARYHAFWRVENGYVYTPSQGVFFDE